MSYLIWTRRQTLASLLGLSAAGALPACGQNTEYAGRVSFDHGVASGDPLTDRVVIWTRVSPEEDGPVPVAYEVAADAGFEEVVTRGEFVTDAARDYTVKVDARRLRPGRTYYYRFTVGDTTSAVGRTKTLPEAGVEAVRFAVCSCSNYQFGYFNAYEHMAGRDDIDAVLHLGDYFYEYSPEGYGGEIAARLDRRHVPAKETVTLADYRQRHAQYKADPQSQAVHAAHPFIAIWDDHESTNDSWVDGAENHQPEEEGDWEARKQIAVRAYFEWMPIRDPEPGDPRAAIWRRFEYGDVATLVMLESRLMARSEQLDYQRDLPFIETPWDMTDPDDPRPILDEAALDGIAPENVRTVRTPFDVSGGTPRPILDWARIQSLDPANLPEGVVFLPNTEKFLNEVLADEGRLLLGPSQQRFVAEAVRKSRDDGVAWQVIGNQVIMARVAMPDLTGILSDEQTAQLEERYPWLRGFIALSAFGLPGNLDAWDGYPAARERLYAALSEARARTVVVTGDTHTYWANELFDAAGARRGVEFGTSSVTSAGLGDVFGPAAGPYAQALVEKNPEVKFYDPFRKGYVHVTLTRDAVQADYVSVSTVTERDYEAEVFKRFRAAAVDGGVGALEEV